MRYLLLAACGAAPVAPTGPVTLGLPVITVGDVVTTPPVSGVDEVVRGLAVGRCYHGDVEAKVGFAIAATGAVSDVRVTSGDPQVDACVRAAVTALGISPIATATTATTTIRFAIGPARCDKTWRLGETANACARNGGIDVIALDGKLVHHVPGTFVFDATDDRILVRGPCNSDDENAANATCVLDPGGASAVYVFPTNRPQLRGAVLTDAGVWVTDGITLALSEYSNKDTFPQVDVGASLAADHVATCADPVVVVPLHRDHERFTMTVCDKERVQLVLDLSAYEPHWRRQ
jgi:hypothetical protein